MDNISFSIDDSVQHVIIGPLVSALQACKDEELGLPSPICWKNDPSTHTEGTLLVNDVNMRIPVMSGDWKAGKLFNFVDGLCGGMVWHSSVGSEADAAKLLHDMENAGSPASYNTENDELKSMGVRFIGRYSWCVPQETDDPISNNLNDEGWKLFKGPQCVFATPSAVRSHIIPDVEARLRQAESRIKEIAEQRLATGETENYEGQFYRVACNDPLPGIAYPPCSNFNDTGVMYTFPLHRDMFGRVWFSTDTKCRAFCIYTNAAPENFGQMRLGSTPVCSKIPHLQLERSQWGNYYELLASALMEMDDATLLSALENCTKPLRDDLVYSASYTSHGFLNRILSSQMVPMTAKLLRTFLVKAFAHKKIEESFALMILACTPDDVLHEAIDHDVHIFHTVNDGIAAGTYSLQQPTGEMLSHRRCSLLGSYIDQPAVVSALLQRGCPSNEILSETRYNWFCNVLCQAASEGYVETVRLLLDAGADANAVVSGNYWNAFVYAVQGGSEAVEQLLRERYPDNEIWSRDNIPLEVKKLPKVVGTNFSSPPVVEEAEVPLGSLEDLRAKVKRDKETTAAEVSSGALNFSGGSVATGTVFLSNSFTFNA